jgi:vacuolar protein sorting-associated protein 53
MLVHAVEQLRQTCVMKPFPDYRTAAHLIEATRLLLGHFNAYTQKVQPMRVLAYKAQGYQETLRVGLVRGFRVVAFGETKVLEIEGALSTASGENSNSSIDVAENTSSVQAKPVIMTTEVMRGGVLFIDALGESARAQFIHEFCQDQLGGYLKEFQPLLFEPKQEKRVSSFKVVEVSTEPEKAFSGLDQIEKRFTWFRDLLKQANTKFKDVFPTQWALHVAIAAMFLHLVRS